MKNIITTLAIFIILFAVLEKDVFSADTWTFTESPIKTIHTYNTETECNVERNKFLAKPLRQDAGPCVLQKTPEIPKNITTGTTQTTTTTTNNPKASTTGTTQTTTTTTNNPKASTTGTTQTTTTQDSITKYWSYYRSDKKDLSGEVFMDEASCMNASSNNPFADKSRFDTTWQNCFISDKNGKPLEEDTYYFQDTDNGIIQVNPRVAKSKPSWEKYTLLAPFAGFNEAPENVGDYLNKIFVIGIALCGALAVVMLVVAGILYMGEESIFGKTKWREQMKNALFGLLIALSAYALLNTIDPRLLGGGGVNIRAVEIKIDPETENVPWSEYSSSGSKILCPEGFVDVIAPGTPSPINVCKTIAADLTKLLEKAKTEGVKLGGFGSRSTAQQKALRIRHGCPDDNTPSNQCNPETARPGYSMHESGKAIDFRCDGAPINNKENTCFKWLSKNAGPLLINLKSGKEPWHWSTTGQ